VPAADSFAFELGGETYEYRVHSSGGTNANGMPFPDIRYWLSVRMYILETYRRNALHNHARPVQFFMDLYRVTGLAGSFYPRGDVDMNDNNDTSIPWGRRSISYDEILDYCSVPVAPSPLDKAVVAEKDGLYRIKSRWRTSLVNSVAYRLPRALARYERSRIGLPQRRMPSPKRRLAADSDWKYHQSNFKVQGYRIATALREKNYGWILRGVRRAIRARLPLPEGLLDRYDNTLRTTPWEGHELTSYIPADEAKFSAVRFTLRDSEEDKLQVAFCESWEKFIAGRYTKMKPGRFLAKYAPKGVFNETDIKKIVELYIAKRTPPKVYFIDGNTPDGWEAVYEHAHGFTSCMMYNHPNGRHIHEGLHGEHHPVRSYCHPETHVKLAYLANRPWDPAGDNDDFEVYARSVVSERPDGTKGYVRCYGDERLAQALAGLGYSNNRSWLVGAILSKRPFPGNSANIIVPYLDHGTMVDHGDKLEVVDSGHACPGMACGYISQRDMTVYTDRYMKAEGAQPVSDDDRDEEQCGCCDGRFHRDDLTYSDYEEQWVCEDCNDEDWTWAIDRHDNEDLVRTRHAEHCDDNDSWYIESHIQYRESLVWDHNGSLRLRDCVVWVECYGEYYDAGEVVYDVDDEPIPEENAVKTHDGEWALEEACERLDGEWYLAKELVRVQLKTITKWFLPDDFVKQAGRYSVEEYFDIMNEELKLRIVPFTHALPSLPVYLSTHRGKPGEFGYEPARKYGDFVNLFIGGNAIPWDDLVEQLAETVQVKEAA